MPDDLNNNTKLNDPTKLPPGEPAKNENTDQVAADAAAKEATEKAAAEAAAKEAADKAAAEAAAKEAADKAAADAAAKEAADKAAAEAAAKEADKGDKTDSADASGKRADQSRRSPEREKIFTWLTVGQYLILGVIGLGIVWYLLSGLLGETNGPFLFALAKPEVARGVITFLVAAGTVSLAVLLVMAAIMSSGSQDLDHRFGFGKEILTLLIGILGTIVGFYYGSTKENAVPLTLSPVALSEPEPKIGEKFTLDAVVIGGSSPYTYSIKFSRPDIIPDVVDQQSAGQVHHEFTIPTNKGANANDVITFTVDVKDANGQAFTYNKDGKQSIKLQAATGTPPSP